IVTSHHPLLLLGAREGEIHVLRRHPETHAVTIEQANIPPGTTADQILTGRWFNLPSTLDEDTKQLIEEHRNLLRAGQDEEHPRVAQLEKILRGRLGTFADTSIDRMALQVAAEVMEEKESTFEKLLPEQKEAIRDEMLKELRSRRERKEQQCSDSPKLLTSPMASLSMSRPRRRRSRGSSMHMAHRNQQISKTGGGTSRTSSLRYSTKSAATVKCPWALTPQTSSITSPRRNCRSCPKTSRNGARKEKVFSMSWEEGPVM